jgi:DNA-binding CsgD family transcriptional regulator
MQTFLTRTVQNIFPFSTLPPIDYTSHEATVASLEARKAYARAQAVPVVRLSAPTMPVAVNAKPKARTAADVVREMEERRRAVAKLVAANGSLTEISKVLGVSKTTIFTDCTALGIEPFDARYKADPNIGVLYRECAAKGMNQKETAIAAGVSPSSVSIWSAANPTCVFGARSYAMLKQNARKQAKGKDNE